MVSCPRCKRKFEDKTLVGIMCPTCGFQLSVYKIEKNIRRKKIIKCISPLALVILILSIFLGGLMYLNSICKIGTVGEGGGIIFFDKLHYSNGWRYLEAAPENLNAMYWSDSLNERAVGEFVNGLGNGARNSYNVVYRYGAKSAAYKATTYGKTDDCYLGTRKEMALLYFITTKKIFKRRISKVDNFSALNIKSESSSKIPLLYWTSELQDKESAYCIDFENGNIGKVKFTQQCLIRPIRKY